MMTLILSLWYRFVTSFGIVDVIDVVNLSAIVAVTVRQAWSQLVLMRKDVSYSYKSGGTLGIGTRQWYGSRCC